MNKKHFIYAVAYGVVLSHMALRVMIGGRESVHIVPNAEGKYAESIVEGSFRVDVREIGSGIMEVTIEPRWRFAHYFMGVGMAVLLGKQHYRWSRQPEKKDDGLSPVSNDSPNEDPLYEEFLLEDTNRRLFPRPHLEKEFQVWQLKRDAPEETHP